MNISQRIGTMTYAIRDVQQVANQVKAQGHEIITFNIGDPNKFDFDVPEIMQKALAKYANEGYYSDSTGELSVRTKIAEYEKAKYGNSVTPNDVIFTQGVSEGILFLFLAFCNPGDRILVPGPSYPAYVSAGSVSQVETIEYRCIEEEGWQPDLDDLRSKMTPNTRAVVIINPNNPTGAVYSRQTLEKLRDIVGEYNAVLVSDEIYDLQILDEDFKFTSVSQLSNDVPAIIFNGFSKNYFAPGWRSAYMYAIDPQGKIAEPYEGIRKLCRMRLSPNTAISLASVAALDPNPPHLKPLVKKIRDRRDLVVKKFNEMDAITTTVPKAAFYIFPKIDMSQTRFSTDQELVIELLKSKHVLFVHGSGFGKQYGANHFRMVYLSQPEILETGLDRFAEFLKENKK